MQADAYCYRTQYQVCARVHDGRGKPTRAFAWSERPCKATPWSPAHVYSCRCTKDTHEQWAATAGHGTQPAGPLSVEGAGGDAAAVGWSLSPARCATPAPPRSPRACSATCRRARAPPTSLEPGVWRMITIPPAHGFQGPGQARYYSPTIFYL